MSLYCYIQRVEVEADAAHGGVDAEEVAGGEGGGHAVGVGGVVGDNILFRFAAAKRGENQYVCGKCREPRVEGRDGFHRSDMSLYCQRFA